MRSYVWPNKGKWPSRGTSAAVCAGRRTCCTLALCSLPSLERVLRENKCQQPLWNETATMAIVFYIVCTKRICDNDFICSCVMHFEAWANLRSKQCGRTNVGCASVNSLAVVVCGGMTSLNIYEDGVEVDKKSLSDALTSSAWATRKA
jgi:hypothetical protein